MQIALGAVRIHGDGYSTEFDVERYFRTPRP